MKDDDGTTYLHDECITYSILGAQKGGDALHATHGTDEGDGGDQTHDKGPRVLGQPVHIHCQGPSGTR